MDVDRWRGTALRSDDWENRAADIRELLDAGTAFGALHARHDSTLLPEAWDQDLLDVRSILNHQGRRWWRYFSIPYYRARRRLATLCRAELPRGLDEQLELIDAVRDAQGRLNVIRKHDPLASALRAAARGANARTGRAFPRSQSGF